MVIVKNKKLKGFTLVEIMMVVALIGILVLIALPKLLPLIAKAKAVEAQLQLKHVLQLEKMYFYEHSTYSDNLLEIGFEQSAMVADGGSANYQITIIEASNKGFVGKATSITDFDGDGTFNIWQVDQSDKLKEITPD